MIDRKKVIKGLEETEGMLTRAVDRGGEMAVMEAFKCLNRVTDALALLKEQEQKWVCPKCNGQPKGVICGVCGQAVKLDDI